MGRGTTPHSCRALVAVPHKIFPELPRIISSNPVGQNFRRLYGVRLPYL